MLLELCRAAAVAPAAPLWTVLHPRAITLDEIESQSRMKATFLAWMLLATFNLFTFAFVSALATEVIHCEHT